MKVGELISDLQKLNPELFVVQNGHPDGDGFDEVDGVDEPFWVKDCGYFCSYAGSFKSVAEGAEGAVQAVRLW